MASSLAANASSSYSFPGYNLSQPYPGTLLPDSRFTWDISVWGNVPYRNSSDIMTWTEFNLGADEDLVKEDGFQVDESWWFCGKAFGKTRSASDEVNENCEGFVSDECLEALQSTAQSLNYCGSVPIPNACDDEDFFGISYGWKRQLRDYRGYQNETGRIADGSKVSFAGLVTGEHERDNFTLYDEAIRDVAIIIIGFAEAPENNRTRPTSVLPGTLKCVTANPQGASRSLDEGSAAARGIPLVVGGLLALMSCAFLV